MPKTIFITGASSGIGLATAELFLGRGWNVVATMRQPNSFDKLKPSANLLIQQLDVTDQASIHQAWHTALQTFASIDVVFNNAGYGLVGVFEEIHMSEIQKQFNTNVYGAMNLVQICLPHLRSHQGMIITTTSVGGRVTFPLYSIYHSSKWALEGFLESLRYELKPTGVRLKVIEPGPIRTDFYNRSATIITPKPQSVYSSYYQQVLPRLKQFGNTGSSVESVANTVWQAANSNSNRFRYPAGFGIQAVLLLKRLLPLRLFEIFIRQITKG